MNFKIKIILQTVLPDQEQIQTQIQTDPKMTAILLQDPTTLMIAEDLRMMVEDPPMMAEEDLQVAEEDKSEFSLVKKIKKLIRKKI